MLEENGGAGLLALDWVGLARWKTRVVAQIGCRELLGHPLPVTSRSKLSASMYCNSENKQITCRNIAKKRWKSTPRSMRGKAMKCKDEKGWIQLYPSPYLFIYVSGSELIFA